MQTDGSEVPPRPRPGHRTGSGTVPLGVNTYAAVIIGAGQAGLAAAHELVRRGLRPGADFLVLDADDGPGGAWRHRWDSLVFGRAHGIADLPGMPLGPTDPEVPASRIVARYYGDYEARLGLDVVRPARVLRVEHQATAGIGSDTGPGPGPSASPKTLPGADPGDLLVSYDLDGEHRTLRTRYVLSATGTWTSPYVPYVPGIADFRGRQLHTHDYVRKEDFAGQRTLVVGGGLSAVQFLLELAEVTETLWATRRPPNFTARSFDQHWGLDVEEAVRARTRAGQAPASVVRTTGIPQLPQYLDGVRAGVLVSRGMFRRIEPDGVVFGSPMAEDGGGLGPSAPAVPGRLEVPESWAPFPTGHRERVDTIFWNTGFRPAMDHLAPLGLHEPGGGIRMLDEVSPAVDPRVLLVGYGSTASTVGANRAGRLAGRKLARLVQDAPAPPTAG